MENLAQDPAVLAYSMEIQMWKLVVEPLIKYNRENTRISGLNTLIGNNTYTPGPHLVIIDGLDECNDPQAQSRIIKMIARVLHEQSGHLGLQFLISSRPEMKIRNTFNLPNVHSLCTNLVLNDHYDLDKDIEVYLRSEFSIIKRTHTLAPSLSVDINWPSVEDLNILVERSSGQFIYASTVMKYISNNRRDPRQRLQTVISLHSDSDESPYADLDALYSYILLT
ncbi:hypothetical protein BDQ17DRAFT_1224053, partial [Cyathus striatus]